MNHLYRNVLEEAGISREESDRRIEESFQAIFYGPDRFYFEAGSDMAYIMDTGNLDVRTEGKWIGRRSLTACGSGPGRTCTWTGA